MYTDTLFMFGVRVDIAKDGVCTEQTIKITTYTDFSGLTEMSLTPKTGNGGRCGVVGQMEK